MAGQGVSSPARTRVCYAIASGAFSGGVTGVSEVADCLGLPFKPVAVLWQVTTAVDVAVSATFTWRPNPGSATGAVSIATWTQPVGLADTVGYVNFNKNDDTGTSIGTGGPISAYGIGGSSSNTGEEDMLCGPGGELAIVIAAGAATGVVNYWLVYEPLGIDSALVQDVAITRINAATVS